MVEEHNKIIRNAAKKILSPHGIFQKGQSRIWVDDNGWFLTIIEFQPSSWPKSSYLNVGICFLWTKRKNISFDIGYRVKDNKSADLFIEYRNNDELFYKQSLNLAQAALDRTLYFRNFKNLQYAKEQIFSYRFPNELWESWNNWNKMMISFLTNDDKAKEYFEIFTRCHQSFDEQAQLLKPFLADYQKIKEHLQLTILEQRTFFKTHGMKKLSLEEVVFAV